GLVGRRELRPDALHEVLGDLALEPLLVGRRGLGGLGLRGLRGDGRRRRRRLLLGAQLVDQFLLSLELLLHLLELLPHGLEVAPQLLALRTHAARQRGHAERENGDRHPHSSRYPSHWLLLPDATAPGTARGGARADPGESVDWNGSGRGRGPDRKSTRLNSSHVSI